MQLPGNRLGYGAFMRALLVALFEWVENGIAPPNSQFPSRAAGTLVRLAAAREAFPKLSNVNFPTVLNELRLRDHSVEPPTESTAYPVFVQSTDADGNALGGIRHPLLAAPLATHSGWWLRASGYGEGELFTVQGSMMPLTETEAERQRGGDPRPSLEARYVSREAWASRLAEATHRLVAERLLRAEDGDRLVAAARESWTCTRRSRSQRGNRRAWPVFRDLRGQIGGSARRPTAARNNQSSRQHYTVVIDEFTRTIANWPDDGLICLWLAERAHCRRRPRDGERLNPDPPDDTANLRVFTTIKG